MFRCFGWKLFGLSLFCEADSCKQILQYPGWIIEQTKEGQGGRDVRVLGQVKRSASYVDFVAVIGYSILKKQ